MKMSVLGLLVGDDCWAARSAKDEAVIAVAAKARKFRLYIVELGIDGSTEMANRGGRRISSSIELLGLGCREAKRRKELDHTS